MARFFDVGMSWECPACRRNIVLTPGDFADHQVLQRLRSAKNAANGYFIHRTQTVACRLCGYFTSTVGLYRPSLDGSSPMRRGDKSGHAVTNGAYAEGQIYPPAQARAYEPDVVPANVFRDYSEAAAIAELSPRAAMLLARRSLAWIVYGFFHGTGETLHSALQSVKHKIGANLFDAVIGLRMTHDVTLDLDITPAHAREAIRIVELLLDVTYVERARRQGAARYA